MPRNGCRTVSSGRSIPPERVNHAHERKERLLSEPDRKSTRLNSSHLVISYAVFCLKKKKKSRCQLPPCRQPCCRSRAISLCSSLRPHYWHRLALLHPPVHSCRSAQYCCLHQVADRR